MTMCYCASDVEEKTMKTIDVGLAAVAAAAGQPPEEVEEKKVTGTKIKGIYWEWLNRNVNSSAGAAAADRRSSCCRSYCRNVVVRAVVVAMAVVQVNQSVDSVSFPIQQQQHSHSY